MRRIAGFAIVVVVLIAAGSFALQAILPSLVVAALRSAGLEASSMTVSVDAWPPLELYLGRADRLTLTASAARYRSFTAQQLVVSASPVDLRQAGSIEIIGTASSAAVGGLPLGQVELAGRCPSLDLVARLPADQVRSMVAGPLGLAAAQLGFAPPDGLIVSAAGLTARADLEVAPDGRALLVSVPVLGRSVEIFELPPDAPLRLTGVAVTDAGLRLDGSLVAPCP